MWKSTATAPFGLNLQLAVIDSEQVHALVFPCRRVLRGWVNSQTGSPVYVLPTHWREWDGRIEEATIGEPERDRLSIAQRVCGRSESDHQEGL
ncbi:hypothetical protein SAMN05216330_11969 [Bradyrhizobium sp. Ghvi]|uniref:hypothetical protein n=1 Tax=Bradyrhizobium sp. Ghvi TaxID=1855319 RepID=UPI0008EFC64B|nr:hypothetical protein [Bradyrhizobium sp. Ghvi]SFQ21891.1 hypothetical protein SAMN05216330_11969 [Bradyrhizobium sp. Ghvi]